MGRQIYSLLLLTAQPPVRFFNDIPPRRRGQSLAHCPGDHFLLSQVGRECGWARTPTSCPRVAEYSGLVNPLPNLPTAFQLSFAKTSDRGEERAAGSLRVRWSLVTCHSVLLIWSWRRDSNPRPSDYKSDALPAELRQPLQTYNYTNRQANCKGNCQIFLTGCNRPGAGPPPVPIQPRLSPPPIARLPALGAWFG